MVTDFVQQCMHLFSHGMILSASEVVQYQRSELILLSHTVHCRNPINNCYAELFQNITSSLKKTEVPTIAGCSITNSLPSASRAQYYFRLITLSPIFLPLQYSDSIISWQSAWTLLKTHQPTVNWAVTCTPRRHLGSWITPLTWPAACQIMFQRYLPSAIYISLAKRFYWLWL